MERLFTPWRYEYVTRQQDGEGCVLCRAAGADDDESAFVLHRGESLFVVLNIYPYTTGHLMIVPYDHVARLEALSADALAEMGVLSQKVERALTEVYRPHGINLGMNLGRCSGAGIAEHLHLHLVPRWCGDTGFLTITGGTRVMPEELASTWRKLHGRI